ncbi:hypothetical protein [Streptomyces sp. V4I2]|uniref:hypothetical protein n=1 Tax=Streptomyces sp. V4I2 TaxID=3042280 RepID=UPI002785B5C6|nr:hypothetical protein [Streptomyces sp. V4I2]MDQ1052050.1 hypothetical protein [Streptomyces sp. V4I2]
MTTSREPHQRQQNASPWTGIDRAVERGKLHSFPPGDPGAAGVLFPHLPRAWIDWVRRYGALASGDKRRYLLGSPRDGPADLDAVRTTRVLRLLNRLPPDLLPIELLPERQVACVIATDERAPVVLLDLDNIDAGLVPWAPTLTDFVYEWYSDLSSIAAVLRHLEKQERAVREGRRAKDQLDRPGDWTITRLCSEDVVLAVLRTRHNRVHNRQDISEFATAALTSFAPGASVRAALCAVLSDAYRAGGPLAAAFGEQGDGQIPGSLRRWAAARGIHLPRRGGWDAGTGERLYALATDLTSATRGLLPLDGLSTGAVCFAVASGMWQPLAVEALMRWSPHPERILTGAIGVTNRLSWMVDQQVSRTALTVAAMKRRIERADQRSASDDDDTAMPVEAVFLDPIAGADACLSGVSLTVPEGYGARLGWAVLAGAEPVARSVTVHVLAVENDLLPTQLPALAERLPAGRLIVVPADANSSTDLAVTEALDAAGAVGLTVLASPDYTTTLDSTCDAAVLRARTART